MIEVRKRVVRSVGRGARRSDEVGDRVDEGGCAVFGAELLAELAGPLSATRVVQQRLHGASDLVGPGRHDADAERFHPSPVPELMPQPNVGCVTTTSAPSNTSMNEAAAAAGSRTSPRRIQ